MPSEQDNQQLTDTSESLPQYDGQTDDNIQTPRFSNLIRNAVSKKKRRYRRDGYDLDLSYITPQIVAMGFPSERLEKLYRNPMSQVQSMLIKNHGDQFKVYNLCSERSYADDRFAHFARFPFDDHQAPKFDMIAEFCEDAHEWLKAGPQRVIVLHCKAGKGRTGLMIACYLLHARLMQDADAALNFYALKRTRNKRGVTIPSQIRYVHMYQQYLTATPESPITTNCSLKLIRVSIEHPPQIANNRDVHITLKQLQSQQLFTSKSSPIQCTRTISSEGIQSITIESTNQNKPMIECDGDCQLILIASRARFNAKLGQIWFNTNFVSSYTKMNDKVMEWRLPKSEIDKACKDVRNKQISASFAVILQFQQGDCH